MAASLAQLEMQTRCGDPACKCITAEMLETDEATAWQLSRAATRGPGSKAMEAALTGTHRGACHRGVVAMLQHSGRGGQTTWGQTNHHGYGRAAAWGMFSGMPHQMSPYDPQPQYYDMQAPPVPPYMMQHENWYPEDHSFHPEPQGHQTGTGSYEHQPPTEATYEGGGPPVDVRTEEFEAQRTQYQGYEQGAWIGQ